MSGIPPAIAALAELSPVEDLILAILRDGLPDINVQSLIEKNQAFPLVLVRREAGFGQYDGDPRFIDSATVSIHAFAEDPDGDEDAAILSDAVRVVMRNAWFNKQVVPGRGSVSFIEMTSPPRRVTDWATAAGPVQYADLPTGIWRYETRYQIEIRKPPVNPFPLPTP